MSRKTAAIYHFTEGIQRLGACRSQLQALELFAADMGYEAADVFCDMSIRRCDRTEFDRFLNNSSRFDALIVKDLRHISRTTGKCMKVLQDLLSKGVSVLTIEDGIFRYEEEPFERPLRVATYNSRFGDPSDLKQIVPVQNEVMKLFAVKKTCWTVINQYFDESRYQLDGEQKSLVDLISNRDKYDLILVHNLTDVHWRTSKFCRVREQLGLDFYSLQEGYLKYTQEAA